jgi:hypothetical protein
MSLSVSVLVCMLSKSNTAIKVTLRYARLSLALALKNGLFAKSYS